MTAGVGAKSTDALVYHDGTLERCAAAHESSAGDDLEPLERTNITSDSK